METELEKDLISLYSTRSHYSSSLQTNYFKARLIPFYKHQQKVDYVKLGS